MAEALCRYFAQQHNLPVTTTSAGLFASVKAPASSYAIDAMDKRGIDLTAHQAKQVDEALISEADLVWAMTPNHVEVLAARYPQYNEKFRTFTAPINDPFGGSPASYENTARQLEGFIQSYLKNLP